MKKPSILIIRQLALGDVLLTTPIIKQIYLDYAGDCEIDVLTLKPEAFMNNPYISKLISPNDLMKSNKIYQKTINLDLAYEYYPHMHITHAYAKVAFGSPDKVEDFRVGIFSDSNDKKIAHDIHKDNNLRDFVVIHMRHDKWPSRNLGQKKWEEIIHGILKYTNYDIYQVGSTHEIFFDFDPRLKNLMGKFSIQELKELIAISKCYIGIDSGTLHVAASTLTPIIGIFTSAHHDFRKPLGRNFKCKFLAITPQIECYGCQMRLPPPITGVVCSSGDSFSPPCKDLINSDDIIKSLIGIIE